MSFIGFLGNFDIFVFIDDLSRFLHPNDLHSTALQSSRDEDGIEANDGR